MANHLLEIRDLTVAYGAVQALWGVSLHVEEGSIVSLVGANGAGKSTLLKTIAGMIRPKKGEVLFAGKKLSGLRPEDVVDAGISLVPEGRRLFSRLTVKENLELGAYIHRARSSSKDSLERAYDLFPILKKRSGQIAGSLSGGEQQMLAIARSMMSKPSILMLDEPSLGLSPLVVKVMFELIESLNRAGVTILLVEQNVYQALKVSRHAYVMKTGQIAMEGSGEELIADPDVQNAYLGTLE
ncbi:MAG: ABC transporter ATP-binding protein [Syntrophorhabdales bacterium]